MDIERLPSGKFATNCLVMELAAIAYNILRMIGQESLGIDDAPGKKESEAAASAYGNHKYHPVCQSFDRACAEGRAWHGAEQYRGIPSRGSTIPFHSIEEGKPYLVNSLAPVRLQGLYSVIPKYSKAGIRTSNIHILIQKDSLFLLTSSLLAV